MKVSLDTIKLFSNTNTKNKAGNTVYEIIAAYRQATLHILNVTCKLKNEQNEHITENSKKNNQDFI